MRLYVARHGRTNYNDQGLFNSDPSVDVHLTKLGIEQAENLAENLKDAAFEVIFISELQRTKQTANIVNQHHHVSLIADKRINDFSSGFENRPTAEYDKVHSVSEDKWNVRLNDGESLEDIKARLEDFLIELKTTSYDSVLVVTSMAVMQAFQRVLQGLSPEDAWNTEISTGSFMLFEL